jgi:hypothetical protein
MPPTLEEQGAAAYKRGEPCAPPDGLHMLDVFSWAYGWLDAEERDPNANPESPPEADEAHAQ